MDEGKGEHGESSDPDDHSNRNKVTPAIADDAFLAEEDEDYNELYGNIYNGQGFLQPLPPQPPRPPPLLSVQNAGGVSLPGTSGIGQKQPFDFVGGNTWLFLGGLHWWTTDAEVEYELCKYGTIMEVKYFCEKVSGKFQGYCRVEFYDPLAAAACQRGLVGHTFNGRPCVVASTHKPFLRMNQPNVNNQGKKGTDEVEAIKPGDENGGRGGIKEGGDGDNRGYGRGNLGRGNNLGMGSRGHGNPMRNRGGGMGGRSITMGPMGRMGGAAPRMLHPRMDPMSRMDGHAGFPGGPIPPFPGILPSYPSVGLRGLAPYGNYSFSGRGMPIHGMGMIPPSGMGGPNMGMCPGSDMGRCGGDEHGGGKVAETSYGEEAAPDHQDDEVHRDRGDSSNAMREKDRELEKGLPSTSERPIEDDRVHDEFDRYVPSENDSEHDHDDRRILDDREISRGQSRDSDRARSIDLERSRSRDYDRNRERGWNRDRQREDRDRYADHHRFTDHAPQHNDERERGRSSRTSIKSRLSYPSRKYTHNGKRR